MKYTVAWAIFLTTACSYEEYAYKEYDPENELDYLRYWCDPKNIEKNKPLSNPSETNKPWGIWEWEWKLGRETISQKECLKKAGQIGN